MKANGMGIGVYNLSFSWLPCCLSGDLWIGLVD